MGRFERGRGWRPLAATVLCLAAGLSQLAGCSSGLHQPVYTPPPDTTAPRLQISGVAQEQEISADTSVSFLARDADGNVVRLLITLDGFTVADEPFNSPQAVTGLTLAWVPAFAGPHILGVTATDASGNSNSLSLTYLIAGE